MSARQNKKARARRHNRERTVTTLTEGPDAPYLVPTPVEDPPGGYFANSSAAKMQAMNVNMGPPNYPSNGFNGYTYSNGGAFGSEMHPQQQPQHQGFFPSSSNGPQLHQQKHQQQQQQMKVNLPPGKNDLEILQNLKQLIKDGQHPFYSAIPNPAALASLYKGTIPKQPSEQSFSEPRNEPPPVSADSNASSAPLVSPTTGTGAAMPRMHMSDGRSAVPTSGSGGSQQPTQVSQVSRDNSGGNEGPTNLGFADLNITKPSSGPPSAGLQTESRVSDAPSSAPPHSGAPADSVSDPQHQGRYDYSGPSRAQPADPSMGSTADNNNMSNSANAPVSVKDEPLPHPDWVPLENGQGRAYGSAATQRPGGMLLDPRSAPGGGGDRGPGPMSGPPPPSGGDARDRDRFRRDGSWQHDPRDRRSVYERPQQRATDNRRAPAPHERHYEPEYDSGPMRRFEPRVSDDHPMPGDDRRPPPPSTLPRPPSAVLGDNRRPPSVQGHIVPPPAPGSVATDARQPVHPHVDSRAQPAGPPVSHSHAHAPPMDSRAPVHVQSSRPSDHGHVQARTDAEDIHPSRAPSTRPAEPAGPQGPPRLASAASAGASTEDIAKSIIVPGPHDDPTGRPLKDRIVPHPSVHPGRNQSQNQNQNQGYGGPPMRYNKPLSPPPPSGGSVGGGGPPPRPLPLDARKPPPSPGTGGPPGRRGDYRGPPPNRDHSRDRPYRPDFHDTELPPPSSAGRYGGADGGRPPYRDVSPARAFSPASPPMSGGRAPPPPSGGGGGDRDWQYGYGGGGGGRWGPHDDDGYWKSRWGGLPPPGDRDRDRYDRDGPPPRSSWSERDFARDPYPYAGPPRDADRDRPPYGAPYNRVRPRSPSPLRRPGTGQPPLDDSRPPLKRQRDDYNPPMEYYPGPGGRDVRRPSTDYPPPPRSGSPGPSASSWAPPPPPGSAPVGGMGGGDRDYRMDYPPPPGSYDRPRSPGPPGGGGGGRGPYGGGGRGGYGRGADHRGGYGMPPPRTS